MLFKCIPEWHLWFASLIVIKLLNVIHQNKYNYDSIEEFYQIFKKVTQEIVTVQEEINDHICVFVYIIYFLFIIMSEYYSFAFPSPD